jgi:hypothetical protein
MMASKSWLRQKGVRKMKKQESGNGKEEVRAAGTGEVKDAEDRFSSTTEERHLSRSPEGTGPRVA